MKNWKTTLCGSVVVAAGAVGHAYPELASICGVVASIATFLGLAVAKDNNVTGV